MRTEKKGLITSAKERVENYKIVLAQLDELANALKKWDKKTIDKRFFEKFFAYPAEDQKYSDKIRTHFSLWTSDKSWGSPYVIYLRNEKVEIENRDTLHIKDKIADKIALITQWREKSIEEIAQLEKADEDIITEKIVKVFKSSGCPVQLWRKILDSFEVKYPQDKN